jgi:hypothetical protein
MQLAPLTFKSIRSRAVVLKLKRPVVARIATITDWPLILIDLITEEGLSPTPTAAHRSPLPRERFSPLAHRVISLRCGSWSLSESYRTSIKPHRSSSIYEYAPCLGMILS